MFTTARYSPGEAFVPALTREMLESATSSERCLWGSWSRTCPAPGPSLPWRLPWNLPWSLGGHRSRAGRPIKSSRRADRSS